MNTTEHLLTCLAEECSEVQKAVSKALRFGLQDGYPGGNTTNAQDIAKEVTHLMAVIDILREHCIIEQPKGAELVYGSKRARVLEYMDYARSTGALID